MIHQVELLRLHGDAQLQVPDSQDVVGEGVARHQVRLPRQHGVRLARVQHELWDRNDQNSEYIIVSFFYFQTSTKLALS